MANPRLRALLWWRKWSKKDWAIATVGFAFTFLVLSFISDSWRDEDSRVNRPYDPATTADLVDLTLLHNAIDRGALCLDGSLPGYHFQKGFGSGSDKWLLHIEGGGWCDSVATCSSRKMTPLGSSTYMERKVRFTGILSRDLSQNPDFFNWNKVKIRYCDGASFTGRPESEMKNGSKLFFRGQLIWEALIDELSSAGLSKSKMALLSGCSAGGLATLIHCDDFRELLPKDATVKCLADAGFFLDEKDVAGNHTMKSFYHDVVFLQGIAKSLHKDCTAKEEPYKCFFPQEIIKNIHTPLFLVNPAYDFWQIQHVLVPDTSEHAGYWKKCRLNIRNCNHVQLEILEVLYGLAKFCKNTTSLTGALKGIGFCFRIALLKALKDFQQTKDGGMFINSCFSHCQTWMAETWHSPNSPRINNRTIAEAVGDWYFNRKLVKLVDCPYPCNPTCYNLDITR